MTDKQEKNKDVKKIKIIKAAIALMTSLILFGTGALIYGFATKAGGKKTTKISYNISESEAIKTNEVFLNLEKKSKIRNFFEKDNKIFIHVITKVKSEKIFVINTITGKIITIIDTMSDKK
jgi:hypothetical protein